ncbi:hypothetical protein D9M72_542620 [compost metagenome]
MLPRPGDAHIEQPALLIHVLRGVGERDRHEPFAEAHEEDRIPFEPLGGVQRRQGHPLDGGGMLGKRPFLQFVDKIRKAELRAPAQHQLIRQCNQCGQRLPAFPQRSAVVRGGFRVAQGRHDVPDQLAQGLGFRGFGSGPGGSP